MAYHNAASAGFRYSQIDPLDPISIQFIQDKCKKSNIKQDYPLPGCFSYENSLFEESKTVYEIYTDAIQKRSER